MAINVKTCEVVQYLQFVPKIKTAQDVGSIAQGITNIVTYACIIHDKDEGKKPHFHAVLTFKTPKTIDSIAKAFEVPTNMINKIRGTTADAQKYLTHANAPDKYQYSTDDVVANFDYKAKMDSVACRFNIDEIIVGIDNGTVKQYNIHQFVPITEFSKPAVKSRINNAFEYRNRKMNGESRDMRVFFVSGKSGVGKTTFAKFFCKTALGCQYPYISSGGAHPFDDYGGESVIICDDFDKDTKALTFSDFLKLTDNYTNSLVGCRFYNKSIAECKALIFTSVTPVKRWFANLCSTEDMVQVYRRIDSWFVIDDDRIIENHYDLDNHKWFASASMKNIVPTLINREKRVNMLDKIASAVSDAVGFDADTSEKFKAITIEEAEKVFGGVNK